MTSDQATDRASTIDLTFVSDARLRAVLAFYYEQAEQAFKAGAYLGTVVASGAVAEGLLTWLLQTNESRARRTSTAVEGKIESWKLQRLIAVATEIDLFGKNTDAALQSCKALQNWRNIIHPYRALRSSPGFTEALALSSLDALVCLTSYANGKVPHTEVSAAAMDFGWFMGKEIAGSRQPSSTRELFFLRRNGVRALIRLNPDHIIKPHEVAAAGLRDCYVEVADFTPPTLRQLWKLISFTDDMRAKHFPVAISCGAGRGRTGTVLACYLVSQGRTADQALDYLRSVRPISFREIDEHRHSGQFEFIRDFAQRPANKGRP